jgi:protein gp37
MADRTSIEWTRGEDGSPGATWNPVTGCTEVSPGCDNCYAKTFAERWRGTPGHPYEHGFDLTLRPARLDQPLRWKRPRRIFVNSMSDLFHDKISADFIAQVFGVMAASPVHTFQVLTKRHGRLKSLLNEPGFAEVAFDHARAYGYAKYDQNRTMEGFWPLRNVWLGVSVEDQRWADIRIPALLDTPAAVRWISAEPLLGPVDLASYLPVAEGEICKAHWSWMCGVGRTGRCQSERLRWVVAGGESGPGARPMHPDWARSLRAQCQQAGVPYLFKQWGAWVPTDGTRQYPYGPGGLAWILPDGSRAEPGAPGGVWMRRAGKTPAGRELDGATHDEYPAVVA